MEKEQLLHYVAPCSLLCYTCLALEDGAFSECAPRLNRYCEGVGEFLADIFRPSMSDEEREKHHAFFAEFHSALDQLSGGACHGCRNDISLKSGCFESCVIPACAQERGVDFCAECDEFPCRNATDSFARRFEKFGRAWESGTRRIREIGVEAYFEEAKDSPHYVNYSRKTE